MFIAAVLDTWPEWTDGTCQTIRDAGVPDSVPVRAFPHCDRLGMCGTRFQVDDPRDATKPVYFKDIRRRLQGAALTDPVRERAMLIFTLLAEAEGKVHGVPADDVAFHELGAWDSIADIVGAAFLIESLGGARWSCEALPMGSGRVRCAHGMLPVPVPAVVNLLEGFPLYQDGLRGERITPTGAAILHHLRPTFSPLAGPLRLRRSGAGFGARTFPGLSNLLRLLVLEADSEDQGTDTETVEVMHFEVDDQTSEDLAVALDRLRGVDGVLDVVQSAVCGKKGRMAAQVQVLLQPAARDHAVQACFTETTTLGVRWQRASRAVLRRASSVHRHGGRAVRVKRAQRPQGGLTAKAEIDDVKDLPGGWAERSRVRRAAENAVLARESGDA